MKKELTFIVNDVITNKNKFCYFSFSNQYFNNIERNMYCYVDSINNVKNKNLNIMIWKGKGKHKFKTGEHHGRMAPKNNKMKFKKGDKIKIYFYPTNYSKNQYLFLNFFTKNNIKHINVSNELCKFNRIYYLYDLKLYKNNVPCLFFGIYNNDDLNRIKNHTGKRFIMFGGSDIKNKNIFEKFLKIINKNDVIISISKWMKNYMDNIKLKNTYLELDLVDYKIFKPIKNTGNCIYVYDGDGKTNASESKKKVYNVNLINKIIEESSKYKFIKSSSLYEKGKEHNNNYVDMPNIYKKCFIGIRLTEHDGNANTVQEFQAMNIPIVHNHSDYGLKWKNIDDILNHIKKYDKKKEKIQEINRDNVILIYCGKLKDENNIIEIIEEFNIIKKENKDVFLKIIWDEIEGDTYFRKRIYDYLQKDIPGIIFKRILNKEDKINEITQSDIGICWSKIKKKDEIDYNIYNIPVIKNNLIPYFNKNKILIMVPYCNVYKPYIEKCMNTILNQTYKNFNIIMINDGVKDFKKTYEKTKILYFNDKLGNGPGASKYHFIKYLQDNYTYFNPETIICIVDGDDYLLSNSSLTLINLHYNINNSLISCGNYEGKWSENIISNVKSYINSPNIRKNSNFYFPPMRTFKMKLIKYINIQDFIYLDNKFIKKASDKVLFIRLIEICGPKKISIINKKLYYYRDHANCSYNTIDKTYRENCIDYIKNLKPSTEIDNITNIYNIYNKKIYLILWVEENTAKGINIDTNIIYNILKSLNYNVSYLEIPISYLKKFNPSNNSILLDGDIYIFSEVCYADIYNFIFKNNKEIICIPNIDSYSTYKPIIKDIETDFINSLKHYSKNNKFNIWCKTKQIYNWLKKYNFNNLHYTHFCYNIIPTDVLPNYDIKMLLNKKKEYLLLDTGTSITGRKYLKEILDIFIENDDIPFTLLVKTTPNVYNRFLRNTKYVNKYNNIEIISKMLVIDELIHFYKNCKYFIYCSKFDGYGLSLAQAIKYNLFIFTFDGLPWCELLESYPRKCLVNCKKDMSKSMGGGIKGKALSQIYYKGDFNDLTYKLKNNKDKYEKIINESYEDCQFVNEYNNKVFVGNIKNYFQKKYKICNIYNNTSVGVVSYLDREKIFIENLMNIILQANEIVIYLNSATDFIRKFLSNISNVHVVYCDKDLKSLTKLKVINYLNNDVNLIIDDDIVYPSDYIEYTYNILKKQKDKKSFYSYNGYTDKFKYPFTIKTQLCLQDNCNLGSGTLFYNKNTLTDNKLEQFLEKILRISVDSNIQLFCDKTLLQFCQENKIKTRIISPKHTYWMINNPKMKYGMLELKKELNIYDLKDIQKINFKDKLININNNLPNNILRFFSNKIDIIDKSIDYFNYYQIYIKDNILYIDNNSNNIFNLDLNKFKDNKSLNKILNSIICEISKKYSFDNYILNMVCLN